MRKNPCFPIVILALLLGAVPALAQDMAGDAAGFYRLWGERPAWSGSEERLVLETLAHAGQEGLDPARYAVTAAGGDRAVTTALLSYMQEVSTGRADLRALDGDMALVPPASDMAAALDTALRGNGLAALLASLPPRHPEYAALKAALAHETDPDKADILRANMERWRWLPHPLEADRIMVNAADASLELWLGGKQVLTSKVIVGRPANRTPMLRAEDAGVTLNPPWNVPHSIAVKEMLPKLKRNRHYLEHENIVLLNGPPGDPHGLTVDWRAIKAGSFPYRLQQLPGKDNALGQIKLELPNRFDVYLHDTPAKSLFARDKRALSHGCVRVQQILPLASYALAADAATLASIQETIASGETRYLPLKRKLPVYFLYWTAFPGPDGAIQYRPDIYGRDARLIAALRGPARLAEADMSGCAVNKG